MQLRRNSTLNLVGQSVPLLAAVVAIPTIVYNLGESRFGAVTLVWSMAAYLGVFDLGIGRALTTRLAEELRLAGGGREKLIALSGLWILGVSGIVFSLVLWWIAPVISGWVAADDTLLHSDLVRSFRLFAISLPALLLGLGGRGMLEAHRAFGWINAIRVPSGVLLYLLSAHVSQTHPSAASVITVLAAVRSAESLLLLTVGWRFVSSSPGSESGVTLPRLLHASKDLLSFGSWITVSGIVTPIIQLLDRWILGYVAGAAMVAYYATPLDILSRVWILPTAIMGAAYPDLVGALSSRTSGEASKIIKATYRLIVSGVTMVLLPATVFGGLALSWWLNPEFSSVAGPVLPLMAGGLLVNSLARIPVGLLHGMGRPKVVALLHIVELPITLAFLLVLIPQYGLSGAALVWLGRMYADYLGLMWLASRALPGLRSDLLLQAGATSTALTLILIAGWGGTPLIILASLGLLVLVGALLIPRSSSPR